MYLLLKREKDLLMISVDSTVENIFNIDNMTL